MFSKLSIILTAVVVAVSAQGTSTDSGAPSATPILDSCTLACLTSQTDCADYTNLTCVCTNTVFQQNAATCIGNCGQADLTSALSLQAAECSSFSLSATGPSATPSATSGTDSGNVTTSAGSSAVNGTGVASGTGVTSVPSGKPATGGSSILTPKASSPTNGASSSASPTTSAASSSTPSSAAGGLVANGGVAALMALIAGFLAI